MKSDTVYCLPEYDFHQERDGSHLLVWGELGKWLVADAELRGFLALFDGKRTLDRVLRRHARRSGRDLGSVRKEARPVVEKLSGQGLLRKRGEPAETTADEPVSIANLTMNVTNECNLRCRWCYIQKHRSEEMDVDAMMDRLAEGFEAGLIEPDASLILLGGEPTMKPVRLLRVLDRAREMFSSPPMISTNGTLLDREMAGALAKLRCEVQVSIDGPTAAVSDAVRGKGVFERAVQGVKNAVDAGAHTILSMVYTRDGVMQFEPYLDLAADLGAAEARFIPMRQIGEGVRCGAEAPDQMLAMEHLLEVLERRPELGALLKRDYFSIQMSICSQSASRNSCGIARRVVLIDADGAVYPCPNHTSPEHACGNLAGESLGDIMSGSPVMRVLRSTYHIDNFSECRSCPFRRWCAGDCRGEVLAVTGDPAGASPHCAALKEIFPRLLWLVARKESRLDPRRYLADGRGRKVMFHG